MGKVHSSALVVPGTLKEPDTMDLSPDSVVSSGDSPPRRRSTLFVKARTSHSDDSLSLDLSAAYEEPSAIHAQDHRMISESLGVFFFSDKEHMSSVRMCLMINMLKRDHLKKGKILVSEGDASDKLYVLSSGEMEVDVDGEPVRALGRGALIGELGLLYDAPRSATVRCLTPCDFWVLEKESFQSLLAVASPGSVARRGRWLAEVPELKALDSVALSVLVSNLEETHLDPGGNLYTKGDLTRRCILIESGVAVIELPPELVDETPERIDALLGIVRPARGRSKDWSQVDMMNLILYLGTPDTKPAQIISLEEAQPPCAPLYSKKGWHFVHEGCILGMGILFGKAGLPFRSQSTEFTWRWETVNESNLFDGEKGSPIGNRVRTRSRSFGASEGAVAPYSCFVHNSRLAFSFFTPEILGDLFGSLPALIISLTKRSLRTTPAVCLSTSSSSRATSRPFLRDVVHLKEMERKSSSKAFIGYSAGDFRILALIAHGTKSTVVLAEPNKQGVDGPKKVCALKIMSKTKVVEGGKLRHTMDECKLLAVCHSPFIASFQGFYQTERDIVLCMEAVYHSDLQRVIQDSSGMPLEVVRFYAASIVLALAHMHKKGIAYRGLHPENVRIDAKGYIRIVDFAFAKQIPYLALESNGCVKIHSKSFTLCGAPEYLAPECIFNTGANHAVDMWALGIIVHEMHSGVTPFAAKTEMDILQAVASTKKSGVSISSSWDLISGPSWKNFIGQLLKPEMGDRLGVAEKNTLMLLEHSFFNSVNKEALVLMKSPPPYIPDETPLSALHQIVENDPFNGNQFIFNRFDAISTVL